MDNNKTCNNCGKQISADFKFCPYCGAKSEEETTKEDTSNIFCSSCGKSIKDDFKVCPFCGEKLKNQNLNNNKDKKEEEIFCKNCGKQINADFKICPYCREQINNQTTNEIKSKEITKSNMYFSEKNSMVCLLLMIAVGHIFVAHRFYVGRIKEATIFLIVNLVSIIISFIGLAFAPLLIISIVYDIVYLLAVWLQDLLKLIRGEFKDSEGKYLKKL